MSDLKDRQEAFAQKLEQHKQTSRDNIQRDKKIVESYFARRPGISTTDLVQHLKQRSLEISPTGSLSAHPSVSKAQPAVSQTSTQALRDQPAPHQQVSLGGESLLQRLDTAFFGAFNLDRYYSKQGLVYPTVYTETLEEFFSPMLAALDYSHEMRQNFLAESIKEAEARASRSGGGIFGYSLPGQGCYLNGWLFVYGSQLTPHAALEHPDYLTSIVSTAAHEKHGHGFLSMYSALGKVKSELGLEQTQLATRFGIRPADDPLSSLHREQANLVFLVSQLLEEGWSTWIERFISSAALPELMGDSSGSKRYSLDALVDALQKLLFSQDTQLIAALGDLSKAVKDFLQALFLLFTPGEATTEQLQSAVLFIITQSSLLDGFFSRILGQPLRYVIGELMFSQAERQLGVDCMPYMALIAANVTFDFSQVGLADLANLLQQEPRLHPDARLAALSQLELQQKNSVQELAQLAENKLSFSVPAALKKG